jgi:hypothetical protein
MRKEIRRERANHPSGRYIIKHSGELCPNYPFNDFRQLLVQPPLQNGSGVRLVFNIRYPRIWSAQDSGLTTIREKNLTISTEVNPLLPKSSVVSRMVGGPYRAFAQSRRESPARHRAGAAALAHPMHAAGRCGGSARHCFAGSSSGRGETGYRFSPAPGRPIHRSGPVWSANAVAPRPRTTPLMIADTAGMPRCGGAEFADRKASRYGRSVSY